jgi:probable rRNA maturation factor
VRLRIDVQYATGHKDVPDRRKIRKWARRCFVDKNFDIEFTVRIVDEEEMFELNSKWRGKRKLTNVLSFPAGQIDVMPGFLGDIVICAPVIANEAIAQGKHIDAHWAHMLIHGILHLQGYDHINNNDAKVMEALETEKLKSLNYPDPYN